MKIYLSFVAESRTTLVMYLGAVLTVTPSVFGSEVRPQPFTLYAVILN